jgi:flagellar motor switch protein FliN
VSSASLPEISVAAQDYARVWAEKAANILEQFHGSPVTATPHTPAEPDPAAAPAAGETLWINFKASGKLAGEQAFQFSSSDGVRMAQLMMSEPVDAAAELNEGYRDALSELFRQFAGVVATACKAKYGGAVEFQLESALAPEWKPAEQAAWIFAAPQLAPLQLRMLFSAELHAALAATQETKPAAPAPQPAAAAPRAASAGHTSSAAAPASAVGGGKATAGSASAGSDANAANLDLLLDVELDATLRFGQREMVLREILDLRPGSVVELNRQLQEPAELLVGGRVIARGEVVIVDGNYGLRITDIVQPQKRLESVRA